MKGNQLQNKLITSHLMVSALAILILIFSLGSIYLLQKNLNQLTTEAIPSVRITKDIKTELQSSLAALRGWMSIRDVTFTEVRNAAWLDGIEPNFIQLKALTDNSGNMDLKLLVRLLEKSLYDLKMWQWRIEDIAQTPGNSPSNLLMNFIASPIAERIIQDVTLLIEEEKKEHADPPRQVLYHLADFRGSFSKSLAFLNQFLITKKKRELHKSNVNLKLAKKNILLIKKQEDRFNESQRITFKNLQNQIHYFEEAREQLIHVIDTKGNDIASKMLNEKAVPLSRISDELIDKIISIEFNKQLISTNQTRYLVRSIFLGMIISIFTLIIVSLWIGRRNARRFLKPISLLLQATKEVASGEKTKEIPVTNKDEIGELTQSFNQMQRLRYFAEKKTHEIIETALDPIITINIDGIIRTANSATTNLFEFRKDELINSNISIIIPEPYHSEHNGYIKQYLETKNRKVIGLSREVEGKTKSGKLIPLLLSVNEIKVGEDHFFTGILHDISEEKLKTKNTQELNTKLAQENKEKDLMAELENHLRGVEDLKKLSDNILHFFERKFQFPLSLFYIIQDEEKKIELFNTFGFKERRQRKSILQFGEGLIGECVKQKKRITIEEPPKEYLKINSGLGDASPKHILLFPLLFEDKVIAAIELCSLKKVPLETQEFIASILPNIAITIQMVLANRKLSALLDETEKQKQYLLQQEEELRSTNEELESQTQAIKQSEEELRSTNDELQDQVELIRKQKEEIDKKTEELIKSNRYKSEFLANMSHELRTPLNSLLILAQSLMKNKEDNLTQEQQEEIKIIFESGSDLLTLINDILDISKVEAGKLSIVINTVQLSDIKSVLERQFNQLAQNKNIGFNIEIDKSTPLDISTDQVRLLQVLKNLVSNAIKFTETGSVSLHINSDDTYFYFNVTDTGIGIPNDMQEHVFSAFEQVDGTTSRRYGGTGLGLAISKRLAHLMQGELTLKSIEGEGSTFSLQLPLAAPDSSQHESETHSVTTKKDVQVKDIKISPLPGDVKDDRELLPSGKPVMLIIDDDILFAQSLSKIIRENDFYSLIAVTGKSGLGLANKYQPNGIILDLGLPDISGEEVLKQLKLDNETKDIPVHIISAQDKNDNILNKGAFSFLQKPVKEEDISHLLKQIARIELNRILVIEDDKITQKGLKELFNSIKEDITLDFAETADAAKNMLSNNKYSCIIIDLGLPDAPGLTLIETIVEDMNVLVPIIVYTARELTPDEFKQINKYTDKIIIKGLEATERLLDEIKLFLHLIEKKEQPAPDPVSENRVLSKIFDGQRILLVDDDLRNTFALSRALESEGLEVIIADNGQLALDKIKEDNTFQLVLMDIMMPIMDGYEAIKLIRKEEHFKDLPIIALTAKATKIDKEKCLNVGATDYMSKPINIEALTKLIKKHLLGRE